jgi:glyoxylase-like metal-dependent hydrolase (beta-lactamase superfamily II)
MGHRSEPGKILENTYLIDGGIFGIKRGLATYVVRGQQSALVDSGTRDSVNDIIQALRTLGQFPVDKIILTHEHWDHIQGVVSTLPGRPSPSSRIRPR